MHACAHERRVSINGRHDRVNAELVNIAIQCGVTASTQARESKPNEERLAPDSYIISNTGLQIDIDVTFALETQLSVVSHLDVTGKVLKKLDQQAKRKTSKYEEYCRVRDHSFVPFVIGVRGGLHSQASQLLSELAAAAVQNGVCEVSQKSTYLTGMVQRLEAAVASGNANVARRWSAMGAGYGLPRGLGGV